MLVATLIFGGGGGARLNVFENGNSEETLPIRKLPNIDISENDMPKI